MRTTITLDPDVARKLKEMSHLRRATFKETVNAVLRRGLAAASAGRGEAAAESPFSVEPCRGGFRPGIDPGKLNQLADQLEADDFAREASATSPSRVAEEPESRPDS